MNDTPMARAPVTDAIERLRGQLKVSDAYAADANKDQLASVWQLQNANLQFILRDLERALAHPPAVDREAPGGVVVPEGWKLVPVEPTREMTRAFLLSGPYRAKPMRDGYAAMLAAAPPPPANIGGDSPSEREKALREALEGLIALQERTDMTHEDAYDALFKSGGRSEWDAARAALLATPAEGGGT